MTPYSTDSGPIEQVDAVIVGAGISGIGLGVHLDQQAPWAKFVILEAMDGFGGTWWTHRYPGARSDNDLYTYGYRFKPWTGPTIATRDEIREYLGAIVEEYGLSPRIRYRHKVRTAQWSSDTGRWTLTVDRPGSGDPLVIEARFLLGCTGYYRHEAGHMPDWPDRETFEGTLIHAQQWPEDLDYEGKRIVVIGSGATATIVPALAETAGHVTMLQRSPTYFIPLITSDPFIDTLKALHVEPAWTHEILRRYFLAYLRDVSRRSYEEPDALAAELLDGVRAHLDPALVEAHFTPRYQPWRQRLAIIPDGDLFAAMKRGAADIVTDEIERFGKDGILLRSGRRIEADIVVAATGFDVSVLGEIAVSVDDAPIRWSDLVTYRGLMFAGLPNVVWVWGYYRSSWTLRVDLLGDFTARLLNHMRDRDLAKVVPELRAEDHDMSLSAWVDEQDFNPGYLLRAADKLPKRGDKTEWRHSNNYWLDLEQLPLVDFETAPLAFSGLPDAAAGAPRKRAKA